MVLVQQKFKGGKGGKQFAGSKYTHLLITLIMTLVNTRAAFEKAVTDAVAAVDNTVEMVYDNMVYKTPGKTKKYIL